MEKTQHKKRSVKKRYYSASALKNAKARLRAEGLSWPALAAETGCSTRLVTDLLAGKLPCDKGKSHALAVRVGLKAAPAEVAAARAREALARLDVERTRLAAMTAAAEGAARTRLAAMTAATEGAAE